MIKEWIISYDILSKLDGLNVIRQISTILIPPTISRTDILALIAQRTSKKHLIYKRQKVVNNIRTTSVAMREHWGSLPRPFLSRATYR